MCKVTEAWLENPNPPSNKGGTEKVFLFAADIALSQALKTTGWKKKSSPLKLRLVDVVKDHFARLLMLGNCTSLFSWAQRWCPLTARSCSNLCLLSLPYLPALPPLLSSLPQLLQRSMAEFACNLGQYRCKWYCQFANLWHLQCWRAALLGTYWHLISKINVLARSKYQFIRAICG